MASPKPDVNLLDLSGKTVLITGACGAIGKVIVKMLLEHGARILVNDLLSESDARLALGELASMPKFHYLQADISDANAVKKLFEQASLLGMPDVVCCHAGVVEAHPIQDYPHDAFDKLFAVNLRSSFLVAQEASQRWLAQGMAGHLIFTSSWVQDVPWPDITPYSASKASLRMLMRGFARELAAKNIRANAVAPGIVGVGMAKRQWDNEPDYRKRAEKAIPLGRLQDPESVAKAFLYLCSDMATYMTGSTLLIDGGCSLYPMDDS